MGAAFSCLITMYVTLTEEPWQRKLPLGQEGEGKGADAPKSPYAAAHSISPIAPCLQMFVTV
jgi:hypothetical protein